MTAGRIAIAIPAHNEEALIGRCLDSLAAQEGAGEIAVVVLANNCSDSTAECASVRRTVAVHVVELDLEPDQRSAGHARRAAMTYAADLGDIILTTDADCVADQKWVAAHRSAFAKGADAVAGRVSADWEELKHHPTEALAIGALEWEYLNLIGQAEAIFDPQAHDPLPRHAQRCGANLGITRAMLDRIGGPPAISVGEDRALLAAVERLDGKIRFDCAPHVTASARTHGRANGGMADALAARNSLDYRCDEQFLDAEILVELWRLRAIARASWSRGDRQFHIGQTVLSFTPNITFGAAWADHLATFSLVSSLTPKDLPLQITRLRKLIAEHG